MKNIIVALLLVIFCGEYQAQVRWKNFTPMNDVRALAREESTGILWAATTGGGFGYDARNQTFTELRNTEGLISNNLSAVAIDSAGSRIIFGSADGMVEFYSPATGNVEHIFDIRNLDGPRKTITKLVIHDSLLYIALQYGLAVFDLERFEFKDTYHTFGTFPAETPVSSIIITPERIIVGTSAGLATASRAANLLQPSSWKTFTTANGLPANSVTSLLAFRDGIALGTAKGVAFYKNDSIWTIDSSHIKQVHDMASLGGFLHVAYELINPYVQYNIAKENSAGGFTDVLYVTSPHTITALLPSDDSLLVGSNLGVNVTHVPLFSSVLPDTTFFLPDGLREFGVGFQDILITKTGDNKLWFPTSQREYKFSMYDPHAPEGNRWRNYRFPNAEGFLVDGLFSRIVFDARGKAWLTSYGRGALEVEFSPDGSIKNYHPYDGKNSSFNFADNVPFSIVTETEKDEHGNLWIFKIGSQINKDIIGAVLPANGDSLIFIKLPKQVLDPENSFGSMTIDHAGTKWMAFPAGSFAGGLMFVNENSDATLKKFDTWKYGKIDGSKFLSKSTTGMAVDEDGELWLGTDQGVNVISNPEAALAKEDFRFRSVFSLRDQAITSISVDALNRKWIGTASQGVFLLGADGSTVEAIFTSTNSPLLPGRIGTIFIDRSDGIAYIATENGISTVTTTAVAAPESFGGITVGPNPFLVPSDVPLRIAGLAASARIKILSAHGMVIRDFASPGGSVAFWDGRTDDGRLVSSGVYLIAGYTAGGAQTGVGKVAVVRK